MFRRSWDSQRKISTERTMLRKFTKQQRFAITNLRIPYSEVVFSVGSLRENRNCRPENQKSQIKFQLVAPHNRSKRRVCGRICVFCVITVSFPCWCYTSDDYTMPRTFAKVSLAADNRTPVDERRWFKGEPLKSNRYYAMKREFLQWTNSNMECELLESSVDDWKINIRLWLFAYIALLKGKLCK